MTDDTPSGDKPMTIFGMPVIETKLDLGDLTSDRELEFASIEDFYGAAGVLFTSGEVGTADNGDGTFTHTFEIPQGPLPATITYENLLDMWAKMQTHYPSRPDPFYISKLVKSIRRKWALRAFVHSLRGFGGWLQIYYPPAPLPHALVYKSNPYRRNSKSKRKYVRITKATMRRAK